MRILEFADQDNAYRVHYSKRDESFDHSFGTQKDHSWVIMFLEMYCPALSKQSWLNMPLEHVEDRFMQKLLRRIEDVDGPTS